MVTNSHSSFLTFDEVEREHVIKVLQAVHGNRTIAAHVLGVNRKTLYSKLQRWGIDTE
jgi:two-component system response regulator HydG